MMMKCKPVWQFQSVEFDYNVNSEADLAPMFDLFSKIIKGLQEIAPEQQKATVNREPLASEKQRQIMKANGIPFTSSTTMSEAKALIQKSMEEAGY